jgi:hypothetical protein
MLIVQDGHQTWTRAVEAIDAGYASGIVWSPGDHPRDRLAEHTVEEPFAGNVQAIDPQLYVARLRDANPKRLADHDLFSVPLRARDLSAQRLPGVVSTVLESQAGHAELTHLISPTVALSSMGDRSAQTALDLADASATWWASSGDARPLLISLALEQTLLGDRDSVNGLLDEVTGIDTPGFYLLFELPPDMDRARAAPLIARALYIVNALATNDYDVWVGYAGLGAYAMRAAGASTVASAWFQKQQWWSPAHWSSTTGGRQPRPRAYLSPVAGSLLLEAELDPLRHADADLYEETIDAAGPIADALQNGESPSADFDRATCSLQLFATLHELESRITGRVREDLERVYTDLTDAADLLSRIEWSVALEPRSGTRSVGAWADAVEGLAEELGVTI